MILEEAKNLNYHAVLHYQSSDSALGPKCERWRVNGKVKTWKRNPSGIRIPIVHGLHQHGYLDEGNVDCFHLESKCKRQLTH